MNYREQLYLRHDILNMHDESRNQSTRDQS